MKLNNRIFKLVSTILICVVIIAIPTIWITKDVLHQKQVLKKCPELEKYHMNLEACYGLLVIQSDVDDAATKYLINDYRHNLYVVAGTNNLDNYIVKGETLYIIDKSPHNSTYQADNGPVRRTVDAYQNGRVSLLQFDKSEDIPNYVAVDINSGEVKRYKIIEESPEQDRPIFLELEKK